VTTYSVLCPGPSLAKWDLGSFMADGPIVAINSAIEGPLPWDIWSCMDGPGTVEEHTLDAMSFSERRGLLVWCPEEKWSERIARWIDLGVRVDPWGDSDDLSITTVLRRLHHMKVEAVDIYGCDMLAGGYAYNEDRFTPARSPAQWEDRWEGERPLVHHTIEMMEDDGIEVVLREAP
jgi:hypothetical protein